MLNAKIAGYREKLSSCQRRMYLGFEPIGASSMKLKQRGVLINVGGISATECREKNAREEAYMSSVCEVRSTFTFDRMVPQRSAEYLYTFRHCLEY